LLGVEDGFPAGAAGAEAGAAGEEAGAALAGSGAALAGFAGGTSAAIWGAALVGELAPFWEEIPLPGAGGNFCGVAGAGWFVDELLAPKVEAGVWGADGLTCAITGATSASESKPSEAARAVALRKLILPPQPVLPKEWWKPVATRAHQDW
jgi:hypothetical protein